MKYTKDQVKQSNDQLRKTMYSGRNSRVLCTPGVNESPDKESILEAVRQFDSFSSDNDPHGEHDFGQVIVNNEKYFFKIDYYDLDLEYGVDPPRKTVLEF